MRLDLPSRTRLAAVASNTFREAMRNRAFIGLGLLAVAFILFSLVLGQLAVVGQGARVVVDFGLFAVGLLASVTAIVMGALLLHKEVEKKTIYTILSKPVQRYEFLLGKYLGMLGILGVQVASLAGIWWLVVAAQGGDFGIEHVKGMLLILFEASMIAAVAVMFSAQTTPVLTGLFSFGIFAVGRVVSVIGEGLASGRVLFADNGAARAFGEVVVAIFPDLSVFNVSQQVLLGVPITGAYLAQAALYAGCYAAVFIVIGMLAFERRDFT